MKHTWTEQEVEEHIQDLCFLSKLAQGAGLELINSRVEAFTDREKAHVNELTPQEMHDFVEYLKNRYQEYKERMG